jgi:hypothetical protein
MILLSVLLLGASLAIAVSSLVSRARGWRPSIEPGPHELLAAWAALVAAVVVSAWLMFVPVISSRSTSIGIDAAIAEQRLTLLEAGQSAILPILAAVLTLAATPLVLRRRRSRYWVEVSGALVLSAFSLLAGFSIGLFLLPVAALMFVAALLGRTSERTVYRGVEADGDPKQFG